jgi:hypothetical protein
VTNDPATIAPSIADRGWQLGSVLPRELSPALDRVGVPTPPAGQRILVVGHDCDVVNPSFEKEPFVEVAIVHPIPSCNPLCIGGRNPRLLHFSLGGAGSLVNYEMRAHDRRMIDRRILLEGRPDEALLMNDDTRGLVGRWLSKRYYRAAFPDAFNERLRPKLNAVKEALQKSGEHVQDIYLTLDTDDELPDSRPYKVVALGTVRAETWDIPAHRTAAQACFDRVCAAMASCAGIQLLDSVLQSDADVTLYDLRKTKRWEYDWLSPQRDEATD